MCVCIYIYIYITNVLIHYVNKTLILDVINRLALIYSNESVFSVS